MIYFIIVTTVLVGTVLSSHSISLVPFYGAYYFLAFFILKSFGYEKDYYLSFQEPNAEITEKKLMVAGHEINSNTESDKQEDRFLNLFEAKKLGKRKFLNGIIFFGGIWFFYSKLGAEISLNTIIPLVSCFLIMNSFFVGHLLLVLLINVVLVTYNYSSTIPLHFYFIYTCLLFSSLFLISNYKGTFAVRKVVTLTFLTLMFTLTSFGFSWILKSNAPPESPKLALKQHETKGITDFLLRNKEDLIKMQNKLQGIGGSSELLTKIGQSLFDNENMQRSLKGKKLTASEKKQLHDQLIGLMGTQDELLNATKALETNNLSRGFTEKEEKVFKDLGLDSKENLTDEEQKTLKDYFNENVGENITHAQLTELTNVIEKKLLTIPEKQHLKQTLEGIQKSKSLAPVHDAFNFPTLKERNEILKPLKPKKDEKSLLDRIKRFLPIAVGLLVFLFANYMLKKKGIKKVEASDPEILDELRNEWQSLRKLNLSPREEVIHFYNLFHVSLQKIHYSEHEAPPSCIIYEDMKKNNPELESSTLVITELFAQCFYGGEDVSIAALKKYRKSFTRILNVYQLN
jgi:hypothetical protein